MLQKIRRMGRLKAKEAKKVQDQVAFELEKAEICNTFAEDIQKGAKHLCSLKAPPLKLLLKYYFEVPTALSKLRRDELQALVEDAFKVGEEDNDEVLQQACSEGEHHGGVQGEQQQGEPMGHEKV